MTMSCPTAIDCRPVTNSLRRPRRPLGGFTLVELLVVITIIGILAGLAVPAVVIAMRRAKVASVALEMNQLDTALKAYKAQFGEYPPDFSDQTATGHATILRHLARAFPRYVPGYPVSGAGAGGTWGEFVTDVNNGWGIDPGKLTPAGAIVFWLGGCPVNLNGTAPYVPAVTGFAGFAADPLNPFANTTTCPSRIQPFIDFDPTRVARIKDTAATPTYDYLAYWPASATGSLTTGAFVYFRAENGAYANSCIDYGDTRAVGTRGVVYPAVDMRLSATTSVNPTSFQLFSSGLNLKYGAMGAVLQFPTGGNYLPDTYDDITNFSGGRTLEDNIP
jgi:prepilin-type N-terminal cleavage/methylation domain-containing protein